MSNYNLENGMVLAQDRANDCYDEIEVTVVRYVKQYTRVVVDNHLNKDEIIAIAKDEGDWEDLEVENYEVE